jgi:hypothetical protein
MNELGCVLVPLAVLLGSLGVIALIVALQTQQRLVRLEASLAQLLAQRTSGLPPTPPSEEPVVPSALSVDLRQHEPPEPPSATLDAELPAAPAVETPRAGVFDPAAAAAAAEQLPPSATVPSRPPFDWESVVGVKLFSWVAGIALALAGVLFLRYSIERGWLSAGVQMTIGLFGGGALIALGELRVSRRYATTANAVDASGLAILYATLFAAHNVWQILPPFAAFLAIVLVTVLAVWLATRRDSAFIALLGLVGGFAAPALLAPDRDRPIALFGYLLAVNIGAAWIAYRRNWPLLTALSLTFTTIYQWHWVTRFLDSSRLPTAAGVFLLFPIVGVLALAIASRRNLARPAFERTTQFASALPLVFGLYAAAIPAYGQSYRLLFSYLFIASAGLAAMAVLRRHEALHLLGGVSTVVAFLVWFSNSWTREAWPHILAITLCFQALYLLAPILASRLMRQEAAEGVATHGFSGTGRRAIYAAPLLMFVLPALASFEPDAANAVWLGTATVLMLGVIGLAAVRENSGLPFAVGFAFASAGEMVWAASYLRNFRAVEGAAYFTAVALLCFGIGILAARRGATCPWLRASGYFGVFGLLLIGQLAASRETNVPTANFLVPIALILLAAALTARLTERTAPFASALVISNLILMMFVSRRGEAPHPSTAVLFASAAAAFALAWLLLAARARFSAPADDAALVQPAYRSAAIVTAALALFSAHGVALAASAAPGAPPFALMLAAQAYFVFLLLFVARSASRHGLAVGAALAAVAAVFAWREGAPASPLWQQLSFGAVLLLPPILYPAVVRRRLGNALAPYVASVIASAGALLYFRTSLSGTAADAVIGLLPLAIAGLLGILLRDLLRLDPGGAARPGRLSLVAGAVLAFATAAVPLQLDNEWLTVAWALEAAALAWLSTRISHRGLLYWSAGLATVVFVRLVLNPAVFDYHERDLFPILNWYLYTYASSAGAIFAASWWLRRTEDRIGSLGRASSHLAAQATLMLFLLLNIEIADFFSEGRHLTFNFSGTLAQDLTYTLGWALFAIGMLIAGIGLRTRPARIAAIGLLAVAVLKCFLHDLGRLGGLYRVGSLLGLAICLGVVAVLLQRFVLGAREESLRAESSLPARPPVAP